MVVLKEIMVLTTQYNQWIRITDEIEQVMKEEGAVNAMMSGSGPTVFGLFENGETAKRALREMKRSGLAKQVYLTTIYNNRRK